MQSGGAETFGGDSAVNVSICVKETNEAVKAIKAALHAAQETLSAGIVSSGIGKSITDELKNPFDGPHNGQDEGSKGHGAHLVSVSPPDSLSDIGITGNTVIILDVLAAEVP